MSDAKLSIWIDLEETLINNWDDKYFLQSTRAIRKWLSEVQGLTEINIWSFAIWDNTDIQHFEKSGLKKDIEEVLRFPIAQYPSVDEIQKMVYSYDKYKYNSRNEFMQLNGKMWPFMKFALQYKNTRFVLIDDAVPNMTVNEEDNNASIQFINVTSLKL